MLCLLKISIRSVFLLEILFLDTDAIMSNLLSGKENVREKQNAGILLPSGLLRSRYNSICLSVPVCSVPWKNLFSEDVKLPKFLPLFQIYPGLFILGRMTRTSPEFKNNSLELPELFIKGPKWPELLNKIPQMARFLIFARIKIKQPFFLLFQIRKGSLSKRGNGIYGLLLILLTKNKPSPFQGAEPGDKLGL